MNHQLTRDCLDIELDPAVRQALIFLDEIKAHCEEHGLSFIFTVGKGENDGESDKRNFHGGKRVGGVIFDLIVMLNDAATVVNQTIAEAAQAQAQMGEQEEQEEQEEDDGA